MTLFRKILVSVSLCLVSGLAYADGPISITITTNAWILPSRTIQQAQAWAAGSTYAQGTYVKNGSTFYMALVGGTNVAVGSGPSGNGQIADGAVTWYSIPPGLRNGYAIVNVSTGKVYLSIGQPAVKSKGVTLMPNGGSFNEILPDAVSVIPEGGTATITAMEW